MTIASDTPRKRHWADVIAIVAGLWAFGEAIWGPSIFAQNAAARGMGALWLAFAIGGLLSVLGVVVAQRARGIGRAMVAIAGVLQIAAPFAYARPYPLPMSVAIVLGLVLLATSRFVGPMPLELPAS